MEKIKTKTITKLKITLNKKDIGEEKSLEELGLFDGKDPNPILKAFFDKYYSILDKYYSTLKNMLETEIKGFAESES